MCGICGQLNLDASRPVDEAVIRQMARVLQHRGPDDHGLFVDRNVGLGHQRLSIIDLSAHGRQPMTNEDESVWIVFNGEIYNYQELRQDLLARGHIFRSHTDTEVILHLYEERGPDCVGELNGMFAFAIWDRKQHRLFAARDRVGIKPFYYTFDGKIFAFASEPKALLAGGQVRAALNPEGLADYLTFQFCLGEKTLFRHIRKLLPGHTLTLGPAGDLALRRYWDLDFEVDTHHTEEYFDDQLLRLLEDSVRLQIRSDVPVGAHLSGGMDSSTVACLTASALGSPLHTFSGGFREGPQYDETRFARIVAAHTGATYHDVFPTGAEFVEQMPRLIYHMDEPAAGPGLFPQYAVSKLASESVKVVLGGQGGDEIFGGYMRYLIAYLEECIRGGIEGTQESSKYVVTFESILPNLPQLQNYIPLLKHFWKDGLFEAQEERYFRLIDRSSDVRGLLAPGLLDAAHGYVPFDAYHAVFNESKASSYINKMTHFDLKTLLPALLQVEDRTSMAVSLESRVPLLDHRIAELVASMPPAVKFRGGRSKHIFRKVVRHLLPTEIFERKDKMGFPVPLNEWYRSGPVREFVRETLLGSTACSRGMFEKGRIEALLESERAYGRGVWGLLCLELWMRIFLDGDGRDTGAVSARLPPGA